MHFSMPYIGMRNNIFQNVQSVHFIPEAEEPRSDLYNRSCSGGGGGRGGMEGGRGGGGRGGLRSISPGIDLVPPPSSFRPYQAQHLYVGRSPPSCPLIILRKSAHLYVEGVPPPSFPPYYALNFCYLYFYFGRLIACPR